MNHHASVILPCPTRYLLSLRMTLSSDTTTHNLTPYCFSDQGDERVIVRYRNLMSAKHAPIDHGGGV